MRWRPNVGTHIYQDERGTVYINPSGFKVRMIIEGLQGFSGTLEGRLRRQWNKMQRSGDALARRAWAEREERADMSDERRLGGA
jgi:hypothetical protein